MLEQLHDVVQSAHRHEKLRKAVCPQCGKQCRLLCAKPQHDIFGTSFATLATHTPYYACTVCERSISASRYAGHLEKCLGISGRSSSRMAMVRMHGSGASSPRSIGGESESEEEGRVRSKKRRLVAPPSPARSQLSRFKEAEGRRMARVSGNGRAS